MACFTASMKSATDLHVHVRPLTNPLCLMQTICPVNVAGPHSLCFDDGTEIWYADAHPYDFE